MGGFGNTPIQIVYNASERQQGRQAQLSNIEAAKAVADCIRTCLGPRAMLKMLLDPMGGVVVTNDGHAILREIDAVHPAAKTIMEACRTQDEEVGDGTTSVVVLAGEILAAAEPLLSRYQLHPLIIINGLKHGLDLAIKHAEKLYKPIDVGNDEAMLELLRTSIGTKLASQWTQLITSMALKAVKTVADYGSSASTATTIPVSVDIKRFVRVERVPGGLIEESRLVPGVVLNKDILHPSMKRRLDKPRVLLIDCTLEYKKGESQTALEINQGEDFAKYLLLEEQQVKEQCDLIAALKPDLVISEKGISDLAQHHMVQAGITALRRAKKSDLVRLARCTGATVVSRLEDATDSDVGTRASSFYIDKIGDEYFAFIETAGDEPNISVQTSSACTILLRGPSKDLLQELERNLQDCMADARNLLMNPRLLPGGGATEESIAMALDRFASEISISTEGKGKQEGLVLKALSQAIEVIPRTLIQNAGVPVIKAMTELRAKHADPGRVSSYGINGLNGLVIDMDSASSDATIIWEPASVKVQCLKTAIEAAILVLRVDDIVAAKTKERSVNNPENEDHHQGEH